MLAESAQQGQHNKGAELFWSQAMDGKTERLLASAHGDASKTPRSFKDQARKGIPEEHRAQVGTVLGLTRFVGP